MYQFPNWTYHHIQRSSFLLNITLNFVRIQALDVGPLKKKRCFKYSLLRTYGDKRTLQNGNQIAISHFIEQGYS